MGGRALTTFTWNGGTGSGGDPTQWTPNGTPNTGDSGIVTSGTVLGGNNTQFSNNTLYLGGTSGTAAFVTDGGDVINFMTPTVDFQTVITSAVPGASAAESSLLDATGRFVNQGTIDAAGPAGSTFTIEVATDGTLPGTFINYSQISVEPGNEMLIDITGTSELANVGVVQVNGGTLVINAATNAIAGGYAPLGGTAVIEGGGTLETNAGYASNTGGVSTYYAFADQTAGNTLKIDNIGSFGGVIVGFGVNDTIDLGTSLAVGKVVYSSTSGILNMENAGGTILASLLIGGPYNAGTIPVNPTTGVAGSFTFTTGTDGNTLLTTTVQNDIYNNTTGSWQTAGNWSTGVPGTADVPFIGLNAKTAFTLDTGTTAIRAGGVYLVDHVLLQISSDTTLGPNNITAFGGTLEVKSGQVLTAPAYRSTGGTLVVDPGATFDLLGRPVINTVGAVNGTIATVSIGGTSALRLFGGDALVDGGTLNAAPNGLSGGGGNLQIGYDGGGTPSTMTVQSSGSNAAIVRDTYALLSSDPTSFGELTLNGNVSWVDEIDNNDNTTRGYMLIGNNNVVGNTPTGVPAAPFSNAATLQVLNGASLTEQAYAEIAASHDSSGVVQIGTGAAWNVGLVHGGFIDVGLFGQGNLTIDDGTVSVGNVGTFTTNGTSTFTGGGIGIGISANASGTMVVENGGQFFSPDGMAIGRGASTIATPGANGTLDVLNGGTVDITNGGISVGRNSLVAGSLLVSGTHSLLEFTGTSGGITVGQQGTGTLDIESGGTFLMDGTNGIGVGQSIGSSGLIIVNGTNAAINEGTNATGMFIGQSGQGTLNVANGGAVTIGRGGLLIGNAGSGGTVSVSGPRLPGQRTEITTLGTTGLINVGNGGGGTLLINGGTVVASANVFVAAGGQTLGSGDIQVNTGTLTADGFSIGQSGSGTLAVGGVFGLVSNTGTNSFNIGFGAGSHGTVTVTNAQLTDNTGFFGVGGTNASGTLFVGVAGLLNTGASGILSDINATGTGQASATINGGNWTVGGQLIVGDTGHGTLNINTSGLVNVGTNTVDIGNQSGGSGTVVVASTGQLLAIGGQIFVANTGATGTLDVNTGGSVVTDAFIVGTAGVVAMSGGTLQVAFASGAQNSGAITGFGELDGSIANGASVSVSGGRLFVRGDITGAGSDTIAGSATLEVGTGLSTSQSVRFGGAAAALQLDNPVGSQTFALTNWQNTDELIIGNGSLVTGANWLNGSSLTGTLEVDTTGGIIDFNSVTLGPGTFPIFNTGSNFVELVSCFVAGTRIATPDGEVAVEALQVGDTVALANGEQERVVWIGHRTIDCARHPQSHQVWPVRIAAGAFGALPRRDLFLSPDHALLIDDVLVPVKHLIDGDAIAQIQVDCVSYYHVELTHHAVLLAEGLPAESYLDVGDRSHFANGGAVVTLYPDLACRIWEAASCAPLVIAGPQLDAAKRRLRAA